MDGQAAIAAMITKARAGGMAGPPGVDGIG